MKPMANQYFENTPSVEHEVKNFNFTLRKHNLDFMSDSGVFLDKRLITVREY